MKDRDWGGLNQLIGWAFDNICRGMEKEGNMQAIIFFPFRFLTLQ
jgi:hypothetical protein